MPTRTFRQEIISLGLEQMKNTLGKSVLNRVSSKLAAAAFAITVVVFAAAASAQTSYIILKGAGGVAPLKATPDSSAATTASVPVGLVVTSAGGANKDANGKTWLKVSYGGNTGWVDSSSTFKVKGGSGSSATTSTTSTSLAQPAAEPSQQDVFKLPAKTDTKVFQTKSKQDIKNKIQANKAKVANRKQAEKNKRQKLIDSQVLSKGRAYSVIVDELYGREEPNLSATNLTLKRNQKVNWTGLEAVFSNGEVWWQVNSFGVKGWVKRNGLSRDELRSLSDLDNNTANAGDTFVVTPRELRNTTYTGQVWSVTGITGSLRLREGPGTSFRAITTIPANYKDLVALGAIENGWLSVNFRNRSGWVSLDYVTPR
ncbi:MAG: SH3 domain-containing protein [Alphaproteobacteria bacterium]